MQLHALRDTLDVRPHPPVPDGCRRRAADGHGTGLTLLATDLVEIHDSRCGAESGRGWAAGTVGTRHEVQVIRRGAFARSVRGRVSLVHSGVAVFSHPGEEACIAHPVAGGDARSIFRLTPAGLHAILGPDRDAEPPFPNADRPIDGQAYLQHQLAVHAARRAATDPLMRLMAEERAVGFLRRVTGDTARTTASAAREARNRRAREYVMGVRAVIAEHFREPLSLSAVATRVGCSPFHLSRIVTAWEGAPIYQLIIRQRLRHGLERVLSTRDSLSTVALDIGFASQSHFGEAFRREFGCPPGAARRLSGVGRFSPRESRTRPRSFLPFPPELR